jgi:peptidoglycan hydrolase-like protein with peptidoglycan-binding domain
MIEIDIKKAGRFIKNSLLWFKNKIAIAFNKIFRGKNTFRRKKKEIQIKNIRIKPRFLFICSGVLAVIVLLVIFGGAIFGSGTKSLTARGTQASHSPDASASSTDDKNTPDESNNTQTTQPSASPTSTKTAMRLKEGMSSPEVSKLQERLMALDYMDQDMPTEYFGPMTMKALELFQRKLNLKMDGIYTDSMKKLLFSNQAKKYTVTLGVSGDDVSEIQSRLRELDYLSKVTGKFGEETEAAVKNFQKKNGLDVDGSVGEHTNEVLFSDEAKAFYYSVGTTGDDVLKLQKRLAQLGYLTTTADGKYGIDTENAVKRFQEQNGFIADGYVGPETKTLLYSSKADANALAFGDNGIDITNIQKRLIALNYLKDKADSYFGSNTEAAVKLFQKTNKLKADGKVGAQTLKALLSGSAKKAPSSSSGTKVSARTKSVNSLIKVAKSKLGSRYVRGAKGPNKFDCSGFVYWCLKQIGVKQGYMTSGGWAATKRYPRVTKIKDLKAGDIISFKGHVGIALGGGKMIDCAPSGNGVRITSLSHSYWQRNFIRGYRIF